MLTKLNLMLLPLLAALAVGAAACDGGDDPLPPAPADIYETAKAAGSFDTLVAAVDAAGLAATLKGAGPFTVFAPTDEAFAALPAGTLNDLLLPANQARLAGILTYHVVAGELPASTLVAEDSLDTVFGQNLRVGVSGGNVTIGNTTSDALITVTDIEASNGVIHVIDAVLLPQDIVDLADGAGVFTTLLAAATAAGLVDELRGQGPLTVFAPTDEAFAALPLGTVEDLLLPENSATLMDILTYHVAAGEFRANELTGMASLAMLNGDNAPLDNTGGLSIGGAEVVIGDLSASNGVVHVIDAVLLPAS